MEKRTPNYPFIWVSILAFVLLIILFIPRTVAKPTSYQSMTAGQLLDVKLGFDSKIGTLESWRDEVLKLYYEKRWLPTGDLQPVQPVPKDPIEQVNESLGLE